MFSIFKKSGTAWGILRRILHSRPVKYGKVHVRQNSAQPKRLIIGISQIHPVLRGKFEQFQASRIAAIQHWIFRLCEYLSDQEGVDCFGKEGYASANKKLIRARLPLDVLQTIHHEYEKEGSVKNIFKKAARQWRQALQKHRLKQAQGAMRLLDALTLLQATYKEVTIFPLERHAIHSTISKKIDSLQLQISAVEHSSEFRSAKSKKGKRLSQKEVQVILKRNKLVHSFNQLLSDSQRDQVIFENVIHHAASESITVFVLGHGHRDRLLTLARKQMPPDMLFVWITPPQLWLWRAILQWLGWTLLLCACAILVFLS